MVERNTVNILINVRFILKACIVYRKHLMTILFKFKQVSKAFWFNNLISDAGGIFLFQPLLQIIIEQPKVL